METWALLIVLWAYVPMGEVASMSTYSTAITHIAGIESKELCEKAKKKILKDLENNKHNILTCVQTKNESSQLTIVGSIGGGRGMGAGGGGYESPSTRYGPYTSSVGKKGEGGSTGYVYIEPYSGMSGPSGIQPYNGGAYSHNGTYSYIVPIVPAQK